MIHGLHALLYADDADRARAFVHDVLGWRSVDAGGGWLIFAAPPTELAVHPADDGPGVELYLMCDGLDATIAELSLKGVVCAPVADQPWGRVTRFRIPGGGEIGLYEPRHPSPLDRAAAARH